jgi:hypothetical protein
MKTKIFLNKKTLQPLLNNGVFRLLLITNLVSLFLLFCPIRIPFLRINLFVLFLISGPIQLIIRPLIKMVENGFYMAKFNAIKNKLLGQFAVVFDLFIIILIIILFISIDWISAFGMVFYPLIFLYEFIENHTF